jgi:hypothetical protein
MEAGQVIKWRSFNITLVRFVAEIEGRIYWDATLNGEENTYCVGGGYETGQIPVSVSKAHQAASPTREEILRRRRFLRRPLKVKRGKTRQNQRF